MTATRHRLIGAGVRALQGTGLHRLAAPLTRGRGAILTFHRVTSAATDGFAPNRPLGITPGFLDALLRHLKARGSRIVALADVPALLRAPEPGPPFVALTFDDGYRDNLDEALPILERHAAPFTLFATPGFLDRTARLWWVELEDLIRARSSVGIGFDGDRTQFATRTLGEKQAAFAAIARSVLTGEDRGALAAVLALCDEAGSSGPAVVDRLCLNWAEFDRLAAHPLAAIGSHTLSHPRLATLPPAMARTEMVEARRRLEVRTGRPVLHLCYPYGGRRAAAGREFSLAEDAGFVIGVTTRPGMLFAAHAAHLLALPRVSVNGLWQTTAALDVLLSGAGFSLWNLGRRLDVD